MNVEYINLSILRKNSYLEIIQLIDKANQHSQSVESLNHVWLFSAPWTAELQASLSITNSRSLLKLMFIELLMPSNPSNPLWLPSPPTFNLSQNQGLFKWVSSSHQVAKVLEFQLYHQCFQWIFRTDFPLGWTDWIFFQSKGHSRVFSSTTVQKHQFFGAHLSL